MRPARPMPVRSLSGALLAAVLVLGVLGAGSLATPTRAATIPTPADDPFYAPPAGYAAQDDGAVLRGRAITPTMLGLPLHATAWQLLYRSTDSSGQPTAEVATVMVPTAAWTGTGPRPLVSYQTAEDSVGTQCEPSYVIRGGTAGATSNAASEVALMSQLLAKGWAVVTSDYEGPDAEFIAAGQEGHGVLDGIRAALGYPADGLSDGAPIALWGYSGGAFATAWATQLAARYAPALRFTAIAIGGVPSEALPAMEGIDGGYGFGLVVGAMIGLERAYPAAFAGLFTAAGQKALDAAGGDCTDQLIATFAFQHLREYTTTTQPFADPKLAALLDAISPVGHGAPTAPVYDYHSTRDELIPVATDNDLVSQYCRSGDTVQVVRSDFGEHLTTELTGAPGAEAFLASRFAGQAVVNNCPPGSAPPPGTATKPKPKPKPKHHRKRRRRHHRRARPHR